MAAEGALGGGDGAAASVGSVLGGTATATATATATELGAATSIDDVCSGAAKRDHHSEKPSVASARVLTAT